VLVVSIDSTDSAEVRRAIAKLQSVGVNNVVGTVANRTKPTSRMVYDDYFFIERPATQAALP
jgi:Mrp family chromosome partitioning ATPase